MKNPSVNAATTLTRFKKRALKDSSVKFEYKALDDEFRLIEQLIKARLDKKMSQAELAKRAGMQQAAIARLEGGQANPTYTTLNKIAKVLDKKVSLV